MDKFEVFAVAVAELQRASESDGAVPKGWIEQSPLGRVLFKEAASKRSRITESRSDWTEKVTSELSQLLVLPAARYELADLIETDGTKVPGSISVDLLQAGDDRRIPLQELLEQSIPSYDQANDYQVKNVIQTLLDTEVKLPPNYEVPDGIKDGADMFVGILLLDAVVSNEDRHDHNIEIVQRANGELYISPVFDNGSSLGSTETDRNRSQTSPKQYSDEYSISFFDGQSSDITGIEAFKQAAELRPEAARVWLERLASIKPEQIQSIFDRLPDNRITTEAKSFATELLDYNRTQLLKFRRELIVSEQDLTTLYQQYFQNTQSLGLAQVKEIAKAALVEKVQPERIVDMLTENSPAYQELVASSGAKQAQKLIVKKAQIELALSQEERSSPQQLPNNDRSKGKSR